MMKQSLSKLLLASGTLFAASTLSAQITVLSTSFTGVAGENINFTNTNDTAQNGNKGVGINLTNDLTLAGGWSTSTITSLDFGGGYSWSNANLGNRRMFTTLGDGSYQLLNNLATPSISNSNRIVVTDGEQFVGMNSGQVGFSGNDSPLNQAVFNMVFSVDATFTQNQLDISFRAGNIATSGAWNDFSEANNGFWQARISPVTVVANAGTVDFGNGFNFGAAASVPGGAGPTVTGSATQTLSPGTYLLQIILFDQASSQRPGIDDLTIVAIPEPSTYAALFGLLALGFVAWRRRKKS